MYFDRELVVVDKPVGILSVADEPGNKATIVDYARTQLRRMGGHGVDGKLGVVHRLDRDTSGLMVFARTAHAQRTLAAQFRQHTIERVYHAIAHGAVDRDAGRDAPAARPRRRPARLVRTLPAADGRRPGRREAIGHARPADRGARRRHAGRVPPRNGTPAPDPDPPVRTRPSAGRRARVHPRLRAVPRSTRRARCSTRERSASCIRGRVNPWSSSAKLRRTSRRWSRRSGPVEAGSGARRAIVGRTCAGCAERLHWRRAARVPRHPFAPTCH